jgi:hypothetical protein
MDSKMKSKDIRYKEILNNLQFKITDTYKGQKLQLHSYIRLGLLCKYDKSIKAIYKLDLAGFFEDANIILRTVFENFITIMYCEINPNKLYKRFFDYNVFNRLSYISEDNEISKLISMINKEEIENMKQKKLEFIKNYKPKKFFKWNDMNILELCKKLDKYYKTKFYSSMYIIIYKNNSEYIHPNIVNIFENYININSKEKKIDLNCNAVMDNDFVEIIENLESINKELLKIKFV